MEPRPDYIAPQNWLEADRALTVEEAARYCGVTEGYLNKLRVSGGGPAFERVSHRIVRYSRAELDEWRNSKRSTSTSEYAAVA